MSSENYKKPGFGYKNASLMHASTSSTSLNSNSSLGSNSTLKYDDNNDIGSNTSSGNSVTNPVSGISSAINSTLSNTASATSWIIPKDANLLHGKKIPTTGYSAMNAPKLLPNIMPNKAPTSLLNGKKKDPIELKNMLSSKVKENEKLKLIIDKLRNEIEILQKIQECEKDDVDMETINPIHLRSIHDSMAFSTSTATTAAAASATTTKKRSNTGNSNKRPHLVSTDKHDKDHENKPCISQSMHRLTLDKREDDFEEISSSPSPSLSLTMSNNSELTELEFDTFLATSISSISPVSSNDIRDDDLLSQYLNSNRNSARNEKLTNLLGHSVELERSRSLNVDELVPKDVMEFLDYDPVTDDLISQTSGSNQNQNVGQAPTSARANARMQTSAAGMPGKSQKKYTASHKFSTNDSLKLERSLSVPTYTEGKKKRVIKKPTTKQRHVKKEVSLEPKLESEPGSESVGFEKCGFCVDGTFCLCAEVANDSGVEEAKVKIEIE